MDRRNRRKGAKEGNGKAIRHCQNTRATTTSHADKQKLRKTADSGEKRARIEVPKSRGHGLIEEQNHVSRNYEISI